LVDNPRQLPRFPQQRNAGTCFSVVPREEIFRHTGLQFMQINTLYQLYALKLAGSPALAMAETLLFMPDLFAYWLTGVKKAELTIASTSQFYNPAAKRWATDCLMPSGCPKAFCRRSPSPVRYWGHYWASWRRQRVGRGAGVRHSRSRHGVRSSGGAGKRRPVGLHQFGNVVIDGCRTRRAGPIDEALALNLTNEIGAEGKVRLLKNIAGLWLWQECRRAWAAEGTEYTYDQMTRMAAAAEPFQAVIDPDAFLEPGQMPQKIASWCRRTGQQPPDTTAATAG